jgi:hypothetical protein
MTGAIILAASAPGDVPDGLTAAAGLRLLSPLPERTA